ncbi:MAG TPA: 4-hydroxy-3-methylbut-2-enyl diphosphate reductase [Crocinitomix sp.]|nr:4-hydroxy-3-methylbut-2-enyl diphosphate reductase [Crocinitomix sp.]
MKKFEIPEYYRSPIISRVKEIRKAKDLRKKDFSPTLLDFGSVKFYIARHFGFCYGVENAIEISYRAIAENPNKKIYLLSQMIHNPGVNEDLLKHGITFIQDTSGKQIIPWSEITKNDIIIIPAFGTTVEIENKIKSIGIEVKRYNTTCPFVEKVWNRSQKLGQENYTVIIHGKKNHEETRATFSHSNVSAKSIIVKDIEETKILAKFISGELPIDKFKSTFKNFYSKDFNPEIDLQKIGVVNQTTMLASETQEITDYLYKVMLEKYGKENIKNYFANTRDTLCYATNDNQTSTQHLLEVNADIAIVVGGYNSSNTSHLVELLSQKFNTYFIKDENEIKNDFSIRHFDLKTKQITLQPSFLSNLPKNIILSSGASCPDATVDRVLQKIMSFYPQTKPVDEVLKNLSNAN